MLKRLICCLTVALILSPVWSRAGDPVVLDVKAQPTGGVMATAIYALCLVGMLTASTIYNQTNPCAARPVLRRASARCNRTVWGFR